MPCSTTPSDARGGRIDPQRLSENLDPSLALPDPAGGARLDRHSLRSGGIFAELPARPTPIRGAQAKADRDHGAAASSAGRPSPMWSPSPTGRCSSSASRTSRSRSSGSGSTCRPRSDANSKVRPGRVRGGAAVPSSQHGVAARRSGRRRHAAACSTASKIRRQPRRAARPLIQAILRQHGTLALAAATISGRIYVTVNIPGVHAARGRGRQGRSIRRASSPASLTSRRRSSPTRWRRSCSIPYWNVPNSIKIEEIAPYLQQGGGLFGGGMGYVGPRPSQFAHPRASGREIDPDSIDWGTSRYPQLRIYSSRPDPTTCSAR